MFKKTFIYLILLFFFLSPSASALGIAPSVMGYFKFVPNQEMEFKVFVYNTDNSPYEVEMDLGGELAEYATLSEYRFVLAPANTEGFTKELTMNLKMPEKLEEPGEYVLKVGANQGIYGSSTPGALGSRVRVATGLFVFVPYPGKYIETDFTIENARVNETIVFKIHVTHRGNETINSIGGIINLYDSSGTLIGIMETNSESLAPDQTKVIGVEWNAINVKPGNYRAVAIVDYDGIKNQIEKDFRIGAPRVIITNVTHEPILNGTPGKIVVKVRSLWDDNIPNVHARAYITRGIYSDAITSPTISMRPWSEANLELYWDTAEAAGPGEYQVNVTVYFFNGTDSKEITLEVIERGGFDLIWIVVLLVIIVVVLIAVFYLKRRKRRGVQKRLA